MRKILYDKNERLTEEGSFLDREIYQAIYPIFERYITEGFKIREVQYIAQHVCLDISLEYLMNLSSEEKK